MRLVTTVILSTLYLFAASKLSAVKVYECVDEEGTHSFRDYCPPGSTPVGEKKLSTGQHPAGQDGGTRSSVDELAEKYPITLYGIPECDACDLVRNFLNQREIPFTEKNVADDVDVQLELEEKIGSLSVPAITIGEDKVLMGYHPTRLKEEFDAIGYPDATAAGNSTKNTSEAE
ncbi:MAG: glutaredoxin family protein [Gammaproteobacteria bacterium]|nr:glutaredoxin family protein [Gammaproteobacteria bacterium]